MIKKFLMITTLLFILATGAQGEALWRGDSLWVAINRQLNAPDAGNTILTAAVVAMAANRSVQQVCYDFPAYERLDTILLTTGSKQWGYALNSDFVRLNWVIHFYEDSFYVPLERPQPVGNIFTEQGKLKGAKPQKDDLSRPRYAFTYADKIWFYPAPDFADTVLLAYYALATEVEAAGDTVQVRPEFREAIVAYACHLLSITRGRSNDAQIYLARYGQMVANYKQEDNRKE